MAGQQIVYCEMLLYKIELNSGNDLLHNSSGKCMARKKRLTIGLMIEVEGTIDIEGYKTSLRSGVAKSCEDQDLNLICLAGGSLQQSPYHFSEKQRNIVYELIDPDLIDGLIIVSTVLSFADSSELNYFFQRVRNIPRIIIGPKTNNIPNITIDNDQGIRNLVKHLIEVHQKKRIAFIKGPEGNEETAIRFESYKSELDAARIAFHPNLVVNGDFLMPSGGLAVKTLIDERNENFDAIVASNDNMALGAMKELEQRGIQVPGEVAVVGFDDSNKAKASLPPLTTVHQPIYEVGYKSVEMLLEVISRQVTSLDMKIPAELIVRQSCGCFAEARVAITTDPKVTIEDDIKTVENSRLDIVKSIDQTFVSSKYSQEQRQDWLEKLYQTIYDDLKLYNKDESSFIQTLYYFLIQFEDNQAGLTLFNGILNSLKVKLFQIIRNKETAGRLNELMLNAQILTGNVDKHMVSSKRLDSELQIEVLYQMSQSLFNKIEIEQITESLTKGLETLGIRKCHILQNDTGIELIQNNRLAEWSRLVFSAPSLDSADNSNDAFFKTMDLLDRILYQDNRFYYLIEPLFSAQRQLGLVLFEPGPEEGIVYEMLRTQISNSFYNTYLYKRSAQANDKLLKTLTELDKANKQLEKLYIKDELTGLYNRRGFNTLSDKVWEIANRSRVQFIICFFDLDNLKVINDTYGHDEGDKAIKSFAGILDTVFRKDDIICRQGGDEFIVLAYGSSFANEKLLEDKVRETIQEFNENSGREYQISTCVGFAWFDPDNPQSINDLIKVADAELYEQKFKKKCKPIKP